MKGEQGTGPGVKQIGIEILCEVLELGQQSVRNDF